VLAVAWKLHPCELRADLQRHYSIDIDHARAGGHSAEHIAALVHCLPSDALIFRAENPDVAWTNELCVLAEIRNLLANLIWGMADPKKRGAKPRPIGPSWMTRENMRSLESRVLSIDELMAELSKPRHKTKEVDNG